MRDSTVTRVHGAEGRQQSPGPEGAAHADHSERRCMHTHGVDIVHQPCFIRVRRVGCTPVSFLHSRRLR